MRSMSYFLGSLKLTNSPDSEIWKKSWISTYARLCNTGPYFLYPIRMTTRIIIANGTPWLFNGFLSGHLLSTTLALLVFTVLVSLAGCCTKCSLYRNYIVPPFQVLSSALDLYFKYLGQFWIIVPQWCISSRPERVGSSLLASSHQIWSWLPDNRTQLGFGPKRAGEIWQLWCLWRAGTTASGSSGATVWLGLCKCWWCLIITPVLNDCVAGLRRRWPYLLLRYCWVLLFDDPCVWSGAS